jgi:hypothetical protein
MKFTPSARVALRPSFVRKLKLLCLFRIEAMRKWGFRGSGSETSLFQALFSSQGETFVSFSKST